MTTDEVLAEVRDRGVELIAHPDGRLFLRGGWLTPTLKRVIQHHKGEVLARLLPPPLPPPREWRWRDGHRSAEPEDAREPEDWHPAGAWWFRRQGKQDWQVVPGRERFVMEELVYRLAGPKRLMTTRE